MMLSSLEQGYPLRTVPPQQQPTSTLLSLPTQEMNHQIGLGSFLHMTEFFFGVASGRRNTGQSFLLLDILLLQLVSTL